MSQLASLDGLPEAPPSQWRFDCFDMATNDKEPSALSDLAWLMRQAGHIFDEPYEDTSTSGSGSLVSRSVTPPDGVGLPHAGQSASQNERSPSPLFSDSGHEDTARSQNRARSRIPPLGEQRDPSAFRAVERGRRRDAELTDSESSSSDSDAEDGPLPEGARFVSHLTREDVSLSPSPPPRPRPHPTHVSGQPGQAPPAQTSRKQRKRTRRRTGPYESLNDRRAFSVPLLPAHLRPTLACPLCTNVAGNDREYRRHRQTHSEFRDVLWICQGELVNGAYENGCMQQFSRKDALRRHLRSANSTCRGEPTGIRV